MGRPRISTDKNNFTLDAPEYVNSVSFTATNAESITVPSWAKAVHLKSTVVDAVVRIGATAAAPTDLQDGTGSHIIGQFGLLFRGIEGKTISVNGATNGVVTAAFYQAL